MGKYVIEDPDETGYKTVDSNGRLYVGTDYESAEVEFAIKKTEE